MVEEGKALGRPAHPKQHARSHAHVRTTPNQHAGPKARTRTHTAARLAEAGERDVAVGALLRGEVLRQARRHGCAAQPAEHIELARDDEAAWAGFGAERWGLGLGLG